MTPPSAASGDLDASGDHGHPGEPADATTALPSPRTPAEWMAAAEAAGLDPRPTPVDARTMVDLLRAHLADRALQPGEARPPTPARAGCRCCRP